MISENPQRAYVIGGETVYRAAMPLAKQLEITQVKRIVTGGDAFFPPINSHEWLVVPVNYGKTRFDENGIPVEKDYSFITYTKICLSTDA